MDNEALILVLTKAILYLLDADSQKSPSTGHFTAPFYSTEVYRFKEAVKPDKMSSRGAIAAWKWYMV